MRNRVGGLWRDYLMGGVESDEWISAYVAHALAETTMQEATATASEAWRTLEQLVLSHAPGLGYNSVTPQDADSSAWAVRLAYAIGEGESAAARACLSCVRRNMRPEGGVATYNAAELLRTHMGDSEASVAGWTMPHVCVTASAACIAEIGPVLRSHLAKMQDEDGRCRAYWWEDDEYATALVIESLAGDAAHSHWVQRAGFWLSNESKSASPFVLALRAFGLRKAGLPLWKSAATRLLDLQLDDGSWPASALMRMPPPDVVDPCSFSFWNDHSTGIGCVMSDRNRLFTTATALRALTACLNE